MDEACGLLASRRRQYPSERAGQAQGLTRWQFRGLAVWSGPMFLRIALSIVLAACACQKPAATLKEEPPPRAAPPSQAAAAARFESPRAVYKRYAETLNAAQWAEAIALFTPAGKAELVVANFKGLALLPGSPHREHSHRHSETSRWSNHHDDVRERGRAWLVDRGVEQMRDGFSARARGGVKPELPHVKVQHVDRANGCDDHEQSNWQGHAVSPCTSSTKT